MKRVVVLGIDGVPYTFLKQLIAAKELPNFAALAGEELEGLGPGAIDADELATDADEVEIAVRLGRGGERSHVYFCDLTPEYVSVNSEYTT